MDNQQAGDEEMSARDADNDNQCRAMQGAFVNLDEKDYPRLGPGQDDQGDGDDLPEFWDCEREPAAAEEYLPDCGLHPSDEFVTRELRCIFPDVVVDYVAYLDPTHVRVSSIVPVGDQEFCATFDFAECMVAELLKACPRHVLDWIQEGIDNGEYPFEVVTQRPFVVTLQTRLGELRHAKREDFIPLIVERVFAPDHPTSQASPLPDSQQEP